MRKSNLLPLLSMLVVSSFITSCSDDNIANEEKYTPQTFSVNGKVEKGPFVSGSNVTIQPMDSKLQVKGEYYGTIVTNNAGNFSLGSKMFETPYAEITTQGYFFNEVTGQLSDGIISLRSLADISDNSTINVNLLTHLKYKRIVTLVNQGKSFKEANRQAQEELFAVFGLSEYNTADAAQFSISSGTDEAAALIAVSSLLLSNRQEAAFTEYLTLLCDVFGSSGDIPDDMRYQIKEDRESLLHRLNDIKSNIIRRYEELGMTINVKDLVPFFDWDDDGVAGNEVLRNGQSVEVDPIIDVPNNGGNYQIKIISPIPLYLNAPLNAPLKDPDCSVGSDSFYMGLYIEEPNNKTPKPISVTKEINNNILTLDIAALDNNVDQSASIPLYDYIGNEIAKITVVQAGNHNNDDYTYSIKLGNDAGKVVGVMKEIMGDAFSAYSIINQLYLYNTQLNTVNQYLQPFSNIISDCWGKLYNSNRYNLTLQKADKQQKSLFQPICDVFSSMIYYHLISLWGDVPYIHIDNFQEYEQTMHITREDSSILLDMLIDCLNKAIPSLPDKRSEFTDINSFFFISKDVARILLANIYMYKQDYANALNVYEDVIKSGFYELDRSDFSSVEGINNLHLSGMGKEVIFAIDCNPNKLIEPIETPQIIPLFTYTDVMLSYCECLYKQGNNNIANTVFNDIISAKDIEIASDNILNGIKEARKKLLKHTTGNFSFMKRNGFAVEEYGIEEYRLLLPIPASEIALNPNLNQNPGY